jgi:hypothetical protein
MLYSLAYFFRLMNNIGLSSMSNVAGVGLPGVGLPEVELPETYAEVSPESLTKSGLDKVTKLDDLKGFVGPDYEIEKREVNKDGLHPLTFRRKTSNVIYPYIPTKILPNPPMVFMVPESEEIIYFKLPDYLKQQLLGTQDNYSISTEEMNASIVREEQEYLLKIIRAIGDKLLLIITEALAEKGIFPAEDGNYNVQVLLTYDIYKLWSQIQLDIVTRLEHINGLYLPSTKVSAYNESGPRNLKDPYLRPWLNPEKQLEAEEELNQSMKEVYFFHNAFTPKAPKTLAELNAILDNFTTDKETNVVPLNNSKVIHFRLNVDNVREHAAEIEAFKKFVYDQIVKLELGKVIKPPSCPPGAKKCWTPSLPSFSLPSFSLPSLPSWSRKRPVSSVPNNRTRRNNGNAPLRRPLPRSSVSSLGLASNLEGTFGSYNPLPTNTPPLGPIRGNIKPSERSKLSNLFPKSPSSATGVRNIELPVQSRRPYNETRMGFGPLGTKRPSGSTVSSLIPKSPSSATGVRNTGLAQRRPPSSNNGSRVGFAGRKSRGAPLEFGNSATTFTNPLRGPTSTASSAAQLGKPDTINFAPKPTRPRITNWTGTRVENPLPLPQNKKKGGKSRRKSKKNRRSRRRR